MTFHLILLNYNANCVYLFINIMWLYVNLTVLIMIYFLHIHETLFLPCFTIDIFVNLTCIIRDATRVKNLVDFFMFRAPGVCINNCRVTAWHLIFTVVSTQLLFVPLFAICKCQQIKQKLPGGMTCADSSAWYLNTFSFLFSYRKLMLSD